MDRRDFMLGCSCCTLAALAGPAWPEALPGDDDWPIPARFARPEPGTDEGGLWALLDREEAKLRRSRFLVRDRALNDYVTGIACALAGEHCPDLRVYIVRAPMFNASMAPNGMMQVWTGLLLRMANEAQLATVLAHEIGHYLARHSLEQLRDAKSMSAFGQFLGIALGAAGAGGLAPVAQLALAAGMFAFSREHERAADRIGLRLMAQSGYPPQEAARVWGQLLAELKAEADWAGDAGDRNILFATHPAPEDRLQDLSQRAAAIAPAQAPDEREAHYQAAVAPIRRMMLEDELRRRRSGETLALLERLVAARPEDGELLFFRGEALRVRAAEGDVQRALAAYHEAEGKAGAPPELYRSMGMLHRQAGEREAADRAFARYLELAPDAGDAAMIRSYMKQGE